MADDAVSQRDLSPRRIIGFACNQAFIFFLFYAGVNYAIEIGGVQFERVDLFAMVLFMVFGFALVRALPAGARQVLFMRPLLYVYAVVMALGSLAPVVLGGNALAFFAQGVLVGLPGAFLLTAWGRTFGRPLLREALPEIFLGMLVAALLCIIISLVPPENPILHAFRLLPLASVVNIEIPDSTARPTSIDGVGDAGLSLMSYKILAGTLLFGAAAGLMEPIATAPVGDAVPYYPVSMVIFAAFLIGALTLLLSDAFGRGTALNKSYRLAVFVMMVGALIVPWPMLAESAMPGEAVVLAGYLALEAVLIALFVVLADVSGQDCALSFSRGFLALFAGEVIGIACANVAGAVAEFAFPAIAGTLVLLGYVFLFTERDFDALSQIVSESDTFEQACARITERFGLSNRESEILAFALRGRSSERIAQELVIAKSTVDTHLRRIYSKCGVHSRQELLDLLG